VGQDAPADLVDALNTVMEQESLPVPVRLNAMRLVWSAIASKGTCAQLEADKETGVAQEELEELLGKQDASTLVERLATNPIKIRLFALSEIFGSMAPKVLRPARGQARHSGAIA
jgi:hypothetical protein